MATANPIFNILNSAKKKEEPYVGLMKFKERTISFSNTSIMRENITRIEKFDLKDNYRIHIVLLIICIIAALVGAINAPIGLIATFLFGIIAVIGILERLKPKLAGLTIELNSGYIHTFLSPDKTGINQLFLRIEEALESSYSFIAKWETNNIKVMNTNIENSTGVVVGGHDSTIHANIKINAHDITSLNNCLKKHGIEQSDIDELNTILKNDTPDLTAKTLGSGAQSWIQKIMIQAAKGIGNVSANLSVGLLVQYLSHYYGWS